MAVGPGEAGKMPNTISSGPYTKEPRGWQLVRAPVESWRPMGVSADFYHTSKDFSRLSPAPCILAGFTHIVELWLPSSYIHTHTLLVNHWRLNSSSTLAVPVVTAVMVVCGWANPPILGSFVVGKPLSFAGGVDEFAPFDMRVEAGVRCWELCKTRQPGLESFPTFLIHSWGLIISWLIWLIMCW